MLKVFDPAGFNFNAPIATLMDVHSKGIDKGFFTKTAALFTKELAELKPEKDTSYIHLIALGDGEIYGSNRNGDYFSKKANSENHHTFTKYANVYRNHKNRPDKGDKVYGLVKHSAHNDDMHRVELVIGVDNERFREPLQKLAEGKDISFSMGARVDHDVCSICGNKAKNKNEYCDHAKYAMGRVLDDGRLIYVDNPNPVFFDISEVRRPADRIAYSLRKVASEDSILSGIEQAELWGLTYPPTLNFANMSKTASLRIDILRKLAAIEKEIEAVGCPENNKALSTLALSTPEDMDEVTDTMKPPTGGSIEGLLGAMADVQIVLPFKTFMKLVMGDGFDNDAVEDASTELPGMFSNMLDEDPIATCEDGCTFPPMMPGSIKDMISGLIPSMSLAEGPAKKRMSITVIKAIPKKITKEAKHVIRVGHSGATAKRLTRLYGKYVLSALEKNAAHEDINLMQRLVIAKNYMA